MPNHVLGRPGDEGSILRQLKVLVILLLLSNIALGVFGFYFLRALDRKYSSLIGQALPTLNDLQTLTAGSMEAMRSTNPTLFGQSSPSRTEMSERARVALKKDRDLRRSVLNRQWLAVNADQKLNFQEAGETFSQTATEVISLLGSGENAEASRRREQSLRPAFDHYVAATTKAADMLEVESLRTSDKLTVRTSNISNMMLGLAGWPVMILCVLMLITAVFVIAILVKVFFSKQEAI
jgi:chemoreceptor-like protein with four helix bundle sensory module